jgi:Kef-type K+ transport system membrane component KefB
MKRSTVALPALSRWAPPRAAVALLVAALVLGASPLVAQEGADAGHGVPIQLLYIPFLLLAAKVAGLVERIGQPSVLGELVIGVILGNLGLVGFHALEVIPLDPILNFLAELGVVVLLFQIGLESNIATMRRVGARALMVAIIGVVVPFLLGTYVVGPMMLGDALDQTGYLFLGAALTATSVGITARVFQDLGKLHLPGAQIVLGAAVIDDVMGLVILAIVSAIATAGSVSLGAIGWIFTKSMLFLIGAIVIGQLAAPRLSAFFSRINAGVGMMFTVLVSFALLLAYLAGVIGLAPIVGAFAAGLVLDPVYFGTFDEPEVLEELRESVETAPPGTRSAVLGIVEAQKHRHVEELIAPLGHFLVPLFFVLTGMKVKLDALFDIRVTLLALAISAVAIAGKLVSGFAASKEDRWLVGWGMVPRGEVGLIFAAIGMQLGVLPLEEFSVIVIMVIITTLLPPPVLAWLLRRRNDDGTAPAAPATPTAAVHGA